MLSAYTMQGYLGIAMGYGMDGRKGFSVLHIAQNGSAFQPASCQMGTLEVKRLGSEADLSPPSSAESRLVELYLHFPIRLQDVVLNYLRTRDALPYLHTP
jgi:hypothetical protein